MSTPINTKIREDDKSIKIKKGAPTVSLDKKTAEKDKKSSKKGAPTVSLDKKTAEKVKEKNESKNNNISTNSSLSNNKRQNSYIKVSEKQGKKGDCIGLKQETNETNETNETERNTVTVSNVSNVSCFTTLHEDVLDRDNFGEIVYYLVSSKNEPKTYDDIKENISECSQCTIRNIIANEDRGKSQYFRIAGKEGKKVLVQLSQQGIDYVDAKLKEYESYKEKKLEQEEREKEKLDSITKLREVFEELMANVKYNVNGSTLIFNFEDVIKWSLPLAEKILDDPVEFFQITKMICADEDYDKISFINLPDSAKVAVEDLRCRHVDKLVCIEGRIVSLSQVMSTVKSAKYECPSCGNVITVRVDEEILNCTVAQPSRCSCGRRGNFRLLVDAVVDGSRVLIEDLQEQTDNPHTQRIPAIIEDELVTDDNIKIFTPGNEVSVNGILHAKTRVTRLGRSRTKQYEFEVINAELLEQDIDVTKFCNGDVKDFEKLAKRINREGLDALVPSFAPTVYGYGAIKKALILQACAKRNTHNKRSIRNKPNILLMGDPGSGKTVLGDFVVQVTAGSKKAVGGGSSGVGLTGSVVKEEESIGGYRVEPGALVLAKDILFLDELNNLHDDDKPKLQEGMSERRISINKASLHVSMKVTAGILACANPKFGHFDVERDYVKQFDIPSPILNRFDEIFIITDKVDQDRDEAIVGKMIDRECNNIKTDYSLDFLKKFFVYIKYQPEPLFSDKVQVKLKKIYTDARKNKFKNVIINPRFMEALNRLLKASAKIRLSSIIETKDIKCALDILNKSHYQKGQYDHFLFRDSSCDEELVV